MSIYKLKRDSSVLRILIKSIKYEIINILIDKCYNDEYFFLSFIFKKFRYWFEKLILFHTANQSPKNILS